MTSRAMVDDLPCGTEMLENQVAGHTFQSGTDEIGMLKDQKDRSVLKAAVKPICGAREIKFYEDLKMSCNDPVMIDLGQFVPEYRGSVKIPFRGKTINFIKLGDITHGMAEPCVIDVKIGKRTWDPLASSDKILAEEQKYAACKQNLGFCIPGFQVYDITTGRFTRFGKEYGKKLNQSTVKDALRIFLNGDYRLSTPLLRQFIAQLRSIQKWMQSQTVFRFYSSSLLLAYDAKLLKAHIANNRDIQTNSAYASYVRASTQTDTFNSNNNSHDNYNSANEFAGDMQINDDDMNWAIVKMIDFAHVFPGENGSVDSNYLLGIQNLIRLFEEFLDI